MTPRDSGDHRTSGEGTVSARGADVIAFQYRAFISYSHKDSAVARWLHGQLESYRVPARLVGRTTATGVIGRRIGTVFRDRDELPVAADLTGQINEALKATQFLIVLCSTASAKSKWVNQEVVNFKRLKGAGSIIAVIVDGEPYATNIPGRADDECFCPALRFLVDADGNITDTPAEPIAADLRPGKDSKRLVKMKVLAGLLGVGLDELVQRDAARRQQRMAWLAIASVAGMAAMGVLTVFALTAREAAERQKQQAEGLIEFMLGDLRQKLEPVGRLDVLDGVAQRALSYFGQLDPAEIDSDSLGRRARSLQLLGQVYLTQGKVEDSVASFEQAALTTSEILSTDPNNPDRIFEHAQSIFWLGYVNWQKSDLARAETAFQDYMRFAARLVEIDLTNPKWNAELGHAHVNLGAIAQKQGEIAKSIDFFLLAIRSFESVIRLDLSDNSVVLEIAKAKAFLADSYEYASQIQEAITAREQEVAIYTEFLVKDPRNMKVREALLVGLRATSVLSLESGRLTEALSLLQTSINHAELAVSLDQSNVVWKEYLARLKIDYAEELMLAGDKDKSKLYFDAIRENVADTYSELSGKGLDTEGEARLIILEAMLNEDSTRIPRMNI